MGVLGGGWQPDHLWLDLLGEHPPAKPLVQCRHQADQQQSGGDWGGVADAHLRVERHDADLFLGSCAMKILGGLSPYKSRFVVKTDAWHWPMLSGKDAAQESVLMTILFMILWCAVMKELLEQHQVGLLPAAQLN